MGKERGEDGVSPSGKSQPGADAKSRVESLSRASRRHLRHPRKQSLQHEPVASRRIWQGDLKFGHCEWCFLRNALIVFITGDDADAETPELKKPEKARASTLTPVCRVGEITILSITENLRESELCISSSTSRAEVSAG
jgi:hypothetical protein